MAGKGLKASSVFATLACVGFATYTSYSLYAVKLDVEDNTKIANKGYQVSDIEEVEKEVTKPKEGNVASGLIGTFKDFSKVEASENDGKMNILLLGVDARTNELKGRSDAMVVLSLTEDGMKMVSIPRDSYVDIVGRGTQDKITHAFAYGGLDMAKATVEKMLDITIDHHLVVNFTSFKAIIDAVGGIEVNSPLAFSEQNAKGVANALHFKKGVQKLNGEEALAYARMRKKDPTGDVGRGERQKQVISATMARMKEIGSLKAYGEIFSALRKGVNTDVGLSDISSMTKYLDAFDNVKSYHVKGTDMKLNGVYYYKVDETSLASLRKTFH